MAETLGRNVLVSVFDGSSTYNSLTGQRNGTLTLTTTTIDTTTKADAGDTAFLASRTSWTVDVDGLVDSESDAAWVDLRDAWVAKESVNCRFTSPAAATYTGACFVTSFEQTGPEDGAYGYSASLQGSAALTIA